MTNQYKRKPLQSLEAIGKGRKQATDYTDKYVTSSYDTYLEESTNGMLWGLMGKLIRQGGTTEDMTFRLGYGVSGI